MKRVALIPNIFTTGSMVCGLSAVLLSLTALQTQDPLDFKKACALIMLAILLDGLDGKIAVLTRSCSDFGVQYDSMADLVSFGVAPAFLITTYIELQSGGLKPTPVCWAMTLVLVVCVALRLARFNLQVDQDEKKSFQGLPSPTPAGIIALLLLSTYHCDWGVPIPSFVLFVLVIVLSGLMVSHISYPSLKKSDFFKTQPLSTFFLVVLLFALVSMEPVGTLLLAGTGYVLYGLILHFKPVLAASSLPRFSRSRKPTS